jgi:hypothetical protein
MLSIGLLLDLELESLESGVAGVKQTINNQLQIALQAFYSSSTKQCSEPDHREITRTLHVASLVQYQVLIHSSLLVLRRESWPNQNSYGTYFSSF